MSEMDRTGYEARLHQFFRVDTGIEPASDRPALPDWLLSGTWITAPAHRLDEMPPEARSFVNEFVPVHGEDLPPVHDRMVAHGDDDAEAPPAPRDSATPPHGDKLR